MWFNSGTTHGRDTAPTSRRPRRPVSEPSYRRPVSPGTVVRLSYEVYSMPTLLRSTPRHSVRVGPTPNPYESTSSITFIWNFLLLLTSPSLPTHFHWASLSRRLQVGLQSCVHYSVPDRPNYPPSHMCPSHPSFSHNASRNLRRSP